MRALMSKLRRKAAGFMRHFLGDKSGNVAMMFGLTGIVMLSAAGGALDWSRAMVTKTRLGTALDAAALAIGTTNNLTQNQLQTMAQQYFNANYPANTIGTPSPVHVVVDGQTISLSVTATVPTTLLKLASINTLDLAVSNQVVRAVTKLRVALVLDNTGSMAETDATNTSKMSALKTASHQLLTQLQAAAINPGDVQVALIPFSLDVNVGNGNYASNWTIDWTDFDSPPPGVTPSTNVGPASGYDTCPFTNAAQDFKCTNTSSNTASCNVSGSSACVTTIPGSSSGSMMGKICPSAHQADTSTGRGGHYYNGCWASVPTKSSTTTCTQDDIGGSQNCGAPVIGGANSYNGDSTTSSSSTATNTICFHHNSCTCSGYAHCTLTGSGNSKVATQTVTTTTTVTVTGANVPPWNHPWQANDHSTWHGCVMDRTQNYDTNNQTPVTGTGASLLPAENTAYCPPALVSGLSYNWTNLNNAIDAMAPNGSTNQTIGFVWGWHALTQGAPLNAPATDDFTTQVIIILSDGLNTQNRWHGSGSSQDSTVDARETLACTNAKAAGVVVYTLFVDLGGTSGNSAPLLNCASDSSKYFDLTTSGAIVSAFNQIGTELANLHLSR